MSWYSKSPATQLFVQTVFQIASSWTVCSKQLVQTTKKNLRFAPPIFCMFCVWVGWEWVPYFEVVMFSIWRHMSETCQTLYAQNTLGILFMLKTTLGYALRYSVSIVPTSMQHMLNSSLPIPARQPEHKGHLKIISWDGGKNIIDK